MENEKFLSLKEIEKASGIRVQLLNKLIRLRVLPAYRIGKSKLYVLATDWSAHVASSAIGVGDLNDEAGSTLNHKATSRVAPKVHGKRPRR